MKKRRSDDLRPEYDLTHLKGGVQGKYYKQAAAGTNLVLLEPDVAQAFPDSGLGESRTAAPARGCHEEFGALSHGDR